MTITPYSYASIATQRATARFTDLKGNLGILESRLSTGKTSQTYSGLGAGAAVSLDMRGQLTTLDGYDANIKDGQNRLALMSTGLTSLNKLVLSTKTAAGVASSGGQVNQEAAPIIAKGSFQQAIDILNTQGDGRYLFSGREAATEPVASYDTMMDGDGNGRAGLKQLIAERKAADLGSSAAPKLYGRLDLMTAASSVSLGEDAAGSPFGFKLASASSTSTAITASAPAGSPAATTLAVATQPVAGDAVSVVLNLPDGTQTTVTLTARAAGSAAADGTYEIGATTDDTAASLGAALRSSVEKVATTTLASASAMKAATDFFDGSAANPPRRIDGPPFDSAVALKAGTAADTVVWYAGGDASGSVRETVPVRVGDGRSVGIGAQANEAAFKTTLASFAVLAAEDFSTTDPTSGARYAALADRVSDKLSFASGQSIPDVATDLSLASVQMKTAATRTADTRTLVQNTLDKAENADPNETAVDLLHMQTQLQASYQATSTILKLSIVNYL